MAAKVAAQYLLDAIRSHTPDYLEQLTSATLGKKLRGWALKIDVGYRNDGMTLEGCKTAIDAAHRSEDTFWRSNLLSGAALRKQYERLRMRSSKSKPGAYVPRGEYTEL